MNEQQWRTGRHPTDEPGPRQRTIYGPDGELRGVMFTSADARLVVDSLNALAAAREENGRLREAVREVAADDALDSGDELVRRLTRLRAALAREDGDAS